MANLKRFFDIYEKYQEVADFAIIYIEEAHPKNSWNFKTQIEVDTHRTIDDRLQIANTIQKQKPEIPMYLDTMDDTLMWAFGALPERLYILLDNIVMYSGAMGPFGYDLNHITSWLDENTSMNKTADVLNNNS